MLDKKAALARIQKGPTLDFFFNVDEGKKAPNTTKSGLSSARQRNVI